jgi:hypothetical protein
MKRESINSNESQLNDDMLHPLIDNMLAERKAGIKKVNDMFGTDIEVDFSGAWLSNEIEEQAILDTMVTSSDMDADGITDDAGVSDVNDVSDDDVKIYPDAEETEAEDVTETEAETDVEPDTEVEDETPTQLVDALEALNESVEQLAETLSDDETAVETEGGTENAET